MISNIKLIDPTRTTGLRARFQADVKRRFAVIEKDIKTSIVENDCFAIAPLQILSPLPRRAFDFRTNPDKLAEFLAWLEKQEEAGVLTRTNFLGHRLGLNGAWTDSYIQSAYLQGIRRARSEMRRAGIQLDVFGNDPLLPSSIMASFNLPIHAETVAMLYMRTFEDLKTVTQVMNADVRRLLADELRSGISQGLAEGRGVFQVASQIAQNVNGRVEAIGINRARTIARTETIRAHHLANVNEYRQIDKDLEVTIQAEWSTANDGSVCDECANMEGKIFSLDEIEKLIPYHPNCVTADTSIATSGILAGMSAFYSGPIFKMVFSNGAGLSVTPNHMLLTPHGFVMAKFMSQSDAILGNADIETIGLYNPNDNGNPARIDNIIRSLSETPGVASRRMPITAIDFHGDGRGCQGDIDVILPDGLLREDFNSQILKKLNEFKLNGRGIFDVLFGDGSFDKLIETSFLAPDRGMGSSREALAFLRGCFIHSKKHGFATVSGDDTIFLEMYSDSASLATKIMRQLQDRVPGVISLQELRDIYTSSIMSDPTNLDRKASLDDSKLDSIPFSQSIRPSDLAQIFSGKISLISISSIEIEHVVDLPVYDITSASSIYFANGILSSNCRCAAIPYIEKQSSNSRLKSLRRAA
jgi:SPP1 gp7 family putative phage head morphogenesis protein